MIDLNRPKHQRLLFIITAIAVVAVAVTLILRALNQNIVFFLTPTMLAAESEARFGQKIRLGGLVLDGSIEHDGEQVHFVVSDGERQMTVMYRGIVPDLFREGQGVIAEGVFFGFDKVFRAESILAKHDENYIPRELKDALEEIY